MRKAVYGTYRGCFGCIDHKAKEAGLDKAVYIASLVEEFRNPVAIAAHLGMKYNAAYKVLRHAGYGRVGHNSHWARVE